MKPISALFAALPLGALLFGAWAAEARPAECRLEVAGAIYGQGPCEFENVADDGSFTIRFPTSPYFAYVLISAPGVADGYWNGAPDSTHAHDNLGELRRDGACWSNAAAQVCAW